MLPFVYMLQYRSIRPHIRLAHVCSAPLGFTTSGPRYIFDHELIFVLAGTGTLGTERGALKYKEGDLLLIPPGVVHWFHEETGETYSHIAIHFDWEPRVQEFEDLTFLEVIVDEKDDPAPAVPSSLWSPYIMMVPQIPASLSELIEQIEKLFNSQDLYRMLQIQALIIQLVIELARLVSHNGYSFIELNGKEEKPASQLKKRSEIIEFIHELHELVELESPLDKDFKALCESLHFSIAHFRRLFKEQIGYAPHTYFTLLRLRKASRLLLETKLTVQEISFACGYEDPKYFGRIFRQSEGMSPLEFRNTLSRMNVMQT